MELQNSEKGILILLHISITSRKIKKKRKHISFQLYCNAKGAKLVEVESPEEDAYILILAHILTGESDTLVRFSRA